jgi:hypothetical protein
MGFDEDSIERCHLCYVLSVVAESQMLILRFGEMRNGDEDIGNFSEISEEVSPDLAPLSSILCSNLTSFLFLCCSQIDNFVVIYIKSLNQF